jgi:predicted P-loop ATPase
MTASNDAAASSTEQAGKPQAASRSAIPDYLTAQARWVLWRWEQRINKKTGETERTKPPVSYRTGKKCDVSDPRNWADYIACESALLRSPDAWDGIGFALGKIEQLDEYVIGADLDQCLDDAGDPVEWALPFLDAMRTYAEISPSGTGIKPIGRIKAADLPAVRRLLDIPDGDKEQARTRTFGEKVNGAAHAPGAQLFLMKRYFTITGRHWPTSPEEIRLLTLDDIARLAEAFGPKEKAQPQPEDETEPDEAGLRHKLGDALLHNPRLKERWEGGTQGLNDTSRSGRDMSILAMLVAQGFTKGETRAALRLFKDGKAVEAEKQGPRYFEEMWRRTKATPHGRPQSPNLRTIANAIEADPVWGGALRSNLFIETTEIALDLPAATPSSWRELTDTLILEATAYWQGHGFPKVNKHVMADALELVAHRNQHHPVREYLSALRWDGIPRVHDLFRCYFNAEMPEMPTEPNDEETKAWDRDVKYLERISTGFMVAAVARVFEPGCKHDHSPIAVSDKQGLFKSSALKALCHDPDWFTDNISPDLSERDTKESLRGKWIIELGEIPHVRKEIERVKQFCSSPVDRYRPAYGKRNQDHPRQCVFFGTSNDLEFADATGNRRFWPFHIDRKVDVGRIAADRDQLWAEAVHLHKAGTDWWLPDDVEEIAAEKQAKFNETDIWEGFINAWAEGRTAFRMEDLFAKDTGITPYREAASVPRADQLRAGRCLRRLGFTKRQETIGSERAWWWRKR